MKITLPTTFRPSFLEGLDRLQARHQANGHRISEIYGAFQSSVSGSGRPAKYLPGVSYAAFREHVAAARDQGIRFNFLLNAPCMANVEYSPEGRDELRELLDQVSEAGVDLVTVSIPLVMEWIRDHYPHLEIKASTITYATTVPQVVALVRAGCTKICLDIDCNRNFRLLRRMVEAGGAEVELIGNPTCLLSCAYRFYHNSCAGHGSQSRPGSKGHRFHSAGSPGDFGEGHPESCGCETSTELTAMDGEMPGSPYGGYSLLRCHLDKLREPAEFLKTPWIRPEDMGIYQDLGISSIKLAGRGLPEEKLLLLAEAYLAGSFEGNLLDLTGWGYWNLYDQHPRDGKLDPLAIEIDNRSLDGFLDFWVEEEYHCHLGCDACQYCHAAADRLIEVDDKLSGAYQDNLQAALSEQTSSRVTREDYQRLRRLWKRGALRENLASQLEV